MSYPVVVITKKSDLKLLATKSPNAAAAAAEFFENPEPGIALVVTWQGEGRRRKYVIRRGQTAKAFASA